MPTRVSARFAIALLVLTTFPVVSAPSPAQAAVRCAPYQGYQQCEAGIVSRLLDIAASDTQHANEWCWAASIQGVFTYYGHPVAQERIVREAFGRIVNLPGSPRVILQSLNRNWIDDNGRPFRVSSDVYSANPVTAAQDLASDHPLIIGSLGHAMVLTDLVYVRDQNGNGEVTQAIVRDPWPTNPRRRMLNPREWYSTQLLIRIRVSS